MLIILFILISGIIAGYLLRNNKKILVFNNKLTMLSIFLLLFLLGISMGANKTIMQNIGTLGFHALLISIATVAGSIVIAIIAYKFILKNKMKNL